MTPLCREEQGTAIYSIKFLIFVPLGFTIRKSDSPPLPKGALIAGGNRLALTEPAGEIGTTVGGGGIPGSGQLFIRKIYFPNYPIFLSQLL